MRCIEPGCDVRLYDPKRAMRCRPHSNALNAQAAARAMEGWQPTDEMREKMTQKAKERQAREKGRRVITDDILAAARQMRADGATYRVIAEWLGVYQGNVRIYLKYGGWAEYRRQKGAS